MVLDTSLINTQNYKVRSKSRWGNPEKGITPFPTPVVPIEKLRSANLFTYSWFKFSFS